MLVSLMSLPFKIEIILKFPQISPFHPKVIQNSGTHMENTILGSFTSTLVGFVIMHNPNNEAIARKYLRTGKFKDMVAVLMQYYEFLNLTVSVSSQRDPNES